MTTLLNPTCPTRLFPSARRTSMFSFVAGERFEDSRPSASRKASRSASRNRIKLGLEAMEDRNLLLTIPVFSTSTYNGFTPVAVSLSPMENSQVTGEIACFSPKASPATVQLTAGELVTASVDMVQITNNAQTFSSLLVSGPNNVSYSASTLSGVRATNPDTGAMTDDSFVTFTAPTTGTYTFGVSGAFNNCAFDTYTLSIRPITLDTSTLNPEANPQDAAKLSYSGGGLYAFLNPTGTTLTLDGPTGRGFQVIGHFTETTTPAGNGLTTATITSTGSSITLLSGLGGITIPTPAGSALVVTTQANGYNGAFGEINSAAVQFPGSTILKSIADPMGRMGDLNGLSNSVGVSTPGVEYGLALGDDLGSHNISGAPVNNAVPYLYLSVNAGLSASLGQVQGSVGGKSGAIVVNPADPFAYVDIQGLPVVSELGFAISQHGYIPFTPDQTPNHWNNQTLYGDLYVKGTLSLADLTDDEVPIDLTGEAVFNFAGNGKTWTTAARNEAYDLFNGSFSKSELNNIAFGANGTVSLDLSAEEQFSLSFPLVQSTFIWNGPSQALYFHGGTVNPLAGTPVAFLDNGNQFSADGYFDESGQFDVDLSGSYDVGGFPVSGGLDVSNSSISATGTLATGVGTATVSGTIYYNGNFDLSGTVIVSIGGDLGYPQWGEYIDGWISGSMNFDISSYGSTTTASISGTGSISGFAEVEGQEMGYLSVSGGFSVFTTGSFSASSFLNQAWNDAESTYDAVVDAWYAAEEAIEEAAQAAANAAQAAANAAANAGESAWHTFESFF